MTGSVAASIADLLNPDFLATPHVEQDLPGWRGAYALVFEVADPVDVKLRGSRHGFKPGWYVYAGSANGPGGVGARLARHFRREKKMHWHIDRLTVAAARIEAMAFRNGNECDLLERLANVPQASVPLPGFGSSDCRTCPAHLLAWSIS